MEKSRKPDKNMTDIVSTVNRYMTYLIIPIKWKNVFLASEEHVTYCWLECRFRVLNVSKITYASLLLTRTLCNFKKCLM